MGKCVYARLVGDSLRKYTCDEVRLLSDHWKQEFRKKNSTDKIEEMGRKDRYYMEFCENIDKFLDGCECLLKCDKCPAGLHEGYFCRCEDRNIELSKYLRTKGQSPWTQLQNLESELISPRLKEKVEGT